MVQKQELLRTLPQVEKILSMPEFQAFGEKISRTAAADAVREGLDIFRKKILEGKVTDTEELLPFLAGMCRKKEKEKLQRVINCTGVIIHTNLGRSPVSQEILKKAVFEMSGYSNLELDLNTGLRGKRGGFAEQLVCSLTGAGAALVVNNNAAAVFLILSEFAAGKEVVVSRGELIQIGGGFRIPDIMKQSGALLVETGTTNITTADDYRRAVTDSTAMIFSAHRSNFTVNGFTETPSPEELASLKNGKILYVRDLGSGSLMPLPGAADEKTVSAELRQGADLVCFSGDKLAGACQAGIICGEKSLVDRLRKNPLMRMLRPGKFTYFLLQESLLQYASGCPEKIPVRKAAAQTRAELLDSAEKILRNIKNTGLRKVLSVTETEGAFGGGALPGKEIPSAGLALAVKNPDAVYRYFLNLPVPVAGIISEGKFILDMLAVQERDLSDLASGLENIPENLLK